MALQQMAENIFFC